MFLIRFLKLLLYAALLTALLVVGRGFGRAYAAIGQGGAAEGAHFLVWLLGYVALGLALGLLAAWDISLLLASTSERFVLGTGARPMRREPRLRKAEELLARQEPLEAIQLLRAYLTDKPRDWQTAIRIAEIYQGPLHNPLAAALEYETILQDQRPPRPARPWILLRLGDAFLHLGQEGEATARFEEVIRKHPRSGAAEKARRRLAAAKPAAPDPTSEEAHEPAAEAAPATPPARPALPPGFRPLGAESPRRR